MTLVLGLFLYQQTGDLWAFAAAFVSQSAFSLLLQGVAGAVTDKVRPKNVLVWSAAFEVALFVAVLSLVGDFDSSATGALAIAIGLSLSRPFRRSSNFAVIYELVPDNRYERINAYLSMSLQIGQALGMVAAGVMLESLSPQRIFELIALLHVGELIAAYMLRRQPSLRQLEEKARAPLAEVARYVRQHPQILNICAIGAVDFALIALFNLLLAPAVEQQFGGSGRWMTFLDMSFALGALVGGAYMSARRSPLGMQLYPTVGAIAAAMATFACFAFMAPPVVMLPAVATMGYFVTLSTVVWSSGLQLATPPRMKGRLSTLRIVSNSLLVAAATVSTSYVESSEVVGAQLFACSIALVLLLPVLVLFASARTRLRSLEASSAPAG